MKTVTLLRICCVAGILAYAGFFMADWLEREAVRAAGDSLPAINFEMTSGETALMGLAIATIPLYFIVLLLLARPAKLAGRRSFNLTTLLFVLAMVILFILNQVAWENYIYASRTGAADILSRLGLNGTSINQAPYLLAAAICLLLSGLLALAGFILLVKVQRRRLAAIQ